MYRTKDRPLALRIATEVMQWGYYENGSLPRDLLTSYGAFPLVVRRHGFGDDRYYVIRKAPVNGQWEEELWNPANDLNQIAEVLREGKINQDVRILFMEAMYCTLPRGSHLSSITGPGGEMLWWLFFMKGSRNPNEVILNCILRAMEKYYERHERREAFEMTNKNISE